jgi:hypothetical protein
MSTTHAVSGFSRPTSPGFSGDLIAWLRGRLRKLLHPNWLLSRACHQLSQTTLATSWMAARKLRAVFS